MQSPNPYQPPGADVSTSETGGIDRTSPFSPSGRFGRLSFLAWFVIVSVIGNFANGLFGAVGSIPSDVGGAALAGIVVISFGSLVLFAIFSIRRCHDFNGSGWLVLLALIPLVNLLFFLYLALKRGDEGANSYAPPRVTAGWERVVGILGVVMIVVMLIGLFAGVAVPVFLTRSGGFSG